MPTDMYVYVYVYIYIKLYRLVVTGARLCPIFYDPMDGSPPGSSVHGIFQARNNYICIYYE